MNKNWGQLFYPHILQRGKEYYKNGKVKGFIQKTDSCMARVLGTHVYNVSVNKINADYPEMYCDCEYAKSGDHCKHEAAVLFYLQQLGKNESKVSYSFRSDNPDTYFNIAKIVESYDVDAEDFNEAIELKDSGDLQISNVAEFYLTGYQGDEYAIEFQGKLSGNRSYPVDIRVLFSKNRMINTDCFADHKGRSYYGYYSYDHLCEHKLALLLLADDYVAKFNPGDETDLMGSKILSSYRKLSTLQKIDETVQKNKIVRLEPKLTMAFRNAVNPLSLSFRIGMEKLYVLKNIPQLISDRESSGAFKLSKSASISFMENDFDEESIKYYEIAKKAKSDIDFMEEKVSTSRYYYGRKEFQLKEKIELSPDLLDVFYDATVGKYIELSGSSNVSRVKVADGKIKANVHIHELSDDDKNFSGLDVAVDLPILLKGKSYDYVLDDNRGTLSRISEISPIVKAFIDNADGAGGVYFTIGKKNLSEFYYRLLPELMECPEVEIVESDAKKYEKYLPPECSITYYLDADDDNIIGKVTASYEDEELPLHKLKEEDFPLPEHRDLVFEQKAVEILMKYLPQALEKDNYICEKSGDNTFEILSEGLKDFMAIGEVKTSKDFDRLKIRKAPTIRLGVSVESGILNLDVSTDDMSEEELLELLESYRKKKKFFRLKNGEFIKLESDDTLEELTATMQSMGISAKEFTKGKLHLPSYRAIYINKLLEEHDEIASDRDSNFKSLIRNFNSVKESDIEVPESLSKVLRGYQTYGFKWLSMLSDLGFGGILADDMGLGKTLQVITLLLSRSQMAKKEKKRIKSLIVCPASLVYNWEEEFKRFAPKIDIKTVTGTQSERKKLLSSIWTA